MVTNFYFARLEFPQTGLKDFTDQTSSDPIERRRNKLNNYVNRSDVVFAEPEEDAVWRFGRCSLENEKIIGRFGKNFTEEQTQWDDTEEDYIEEREEVEVADVSHFVIFPEIPGIAFNRRHRIGPSQFRDAFVGGYNQENASGKIRMQILRVGGDYDYAEITQIAHSLQSIEFSLVPTNPYPDDDMEILDDHIRAMGADDFGLSAEAEEGELDPNEDVLRSAGAMSDGEYGEFQAEFEDESGEEIRYNSRGEYATQERPEPESIGGLIPYIDELGEKLRALMFREEGSNSDNTPEDSDPSED